MRKWTCMVRSAVKVEFETGQVWQQNPLRKEAQVGSYMCLFSLCAKTLCVFPSLNDGFACRQGKKKVSFEVLVCFNNPLVTASIKSKRENTLNNCKNVPKCDKY